MSSKNHIPQIGLNDGQAMRDKIRDLKAQLSAKSQEIVNLERGIAGYSKEVSELQKIASDQDSELSSLRAENERLNHLTRNSQAIDNKLLSANIDARSE